MASRLVSLPSMTMRSGRPWRANAFVKKRLAAGKSRYSLNQNSTVSPTLSMAPADLDVGLVRMPFAGHGALAPVKAFHQQRREMNDPAMDR